MGIFNIMYTDGYIQLVDKHLRETPISTTPFPNYINSCSTNTPTDKSGVIRKIENTVVVPGFVAYPYLEDPFDDIDNQDKHLLHNIFPSMSYSFSPPVLYSGFNHCIRHLMLFQDEHHLYNEYKSHFISQLSAITDSSCIEKKGISGGEYASMFYFTALHKLSFVPSYKDELACFVCRIIRILRYVYWSIICLLSSIGNYKKCLQDIVCCIERLNVSVRFFEQCLQCCIKTYINSLESSCSLERLEFKIECAVGECIREALKILGASFKVIMDSTVKVEYPVEQLESIVIDASRSRMCLIESKLKGLKSCICSYICNLRRIWCSLSCNKSPKDILDELTSIIKSIEETLELSKDHAREVRCIVESDCATLECIRYRLSKMCPSIQKIVLSLKFSVRIFVLSTKGIVCDLNSLDYSITCQIPDFEPYLLGIECNLQYITSVISWIQSDICSHFDNARNTIYPADCVISYIDYYWSVLDSFIEVKPFLKCSVKSINKNMSELQRRFMRENKNGSSVSRVTNSNEHNNFTSKKVGYVYDLIWSLMSNMAIVESKFVLSKLYESITTTNKMLGWLWWIENCKCFDYFLLENNEGPYSMANIRRFEYEEFHKVHYGKADDVPGNYLCMCSVICHVLYQNFIRCLCYLVDFDFDTLSTMERRFDKYNRTARYRLDLSKTILLTMYMCKKIADQIYVKYFPPLGGNYTKKLICFCRCPNDPYYKYFISTILYISSLVENMFDHQNEITGDSIQSLSFMLDELSSIGHLSQDKCPPAEQVGESQSTSSQQTESNRCPSVQTPNNIILMELYKSLASIFSQNLRLLKFGGVYFLLGLEFFVYQLSNLASILNPMVSSNWNNSIVGYLKSVEYTIIVRSKSRDGLKSFYQFFSMLSFSLINSNCLCESTKKKVREVTILVASVYISIVSKKKEQKKKVEENECFFKEPADRIIVASCITLIYYWYNDLSLKLSNKVVLDFIVSSEECNKNKKILYYLTRRTISYPENMCKNSRTNRIVDSTSGISNKVFEGVSNNHYSYNDAYRINTSRAHGSLKYIIIKIVLILIIVAMTILHRSCRSISRQKNVSWSIIHPFETGFQMESYINHISK